jgi:hypothetical protein
MWPYIAGFGVGAVTVLISVLVGAAIALTDRDKK